MGRCWLGGSSGDAPHAVLCAAGFNIRWLLRAIAPKGLAALLLGLSQLALYAACVRAAARIARSGAVHVTKPLAWLERRRMVAA